VVKVYDLVLLTYQNQPELFNNNPDHTLQGLKKYAVNRGNFYIETTAQ
jgi:hypothetical protein